jgi:peptidoglycan-N-acetylmuramic acid deacetylase
LQPSAASEIAFIEEFDGFYIDREHGDNCSDKVIYLTFDAGYENGNIEKVLDTLKEEQVSGAFFILGNLINKNTELVIRMFDEGHLVCNHTFSHSAMVNRSKEEFAQELEKIEKFCFEKTGHNMAKYYRPPEGRFDRSSMQYAKELGYKTVFWSFAYADWDNSSQMSAEKAKNKILSNIHNGEIMLLHPTSATNAQILGDVIRELKAQGFRFGSLDELGAK